jgi:hypothetical protein
MSGKVRGASAAIAIAFATLVAGQLAAPAAAFHIPNAAYSGYASGGGSISFQISSDGSSVTNLTLNGPIESNGCTTGTKQYSQPIPISNNSFDNGEVSGSFPNVRGAYGHFNIAVAGLPMSCRVTGTWSAITGASPAGSKECKQAQAKTHKIKRALRRAERRRDESKVRKLGGKWRKARAKRDQYCG